MFADDLVMVVASAAGQSIDVIRGKMAIGGLHVSPGVSFSEPGIRRQTDMIC